MDKIVNSLRSGRFVFWEEIARDGAQAKTLLNAKQRIEIAKLNSKIFNENGSDHLVFAAGFISIDKEEQKIIKELAETVDDCYIAVNGRSSVKEIDLCIESVKNAKFSRVAYVLPASERLCNLMLHKSKKESFQHGIEIAKYAVDKANGIPVDIQLAGSFDSDPAFIAESAAALKEQGIAIVHLGDTRGGLYPKEVSFYIDKMISCSDADQLYGVHFHNDLDFAMVNNFASIKRGIKLTASSWLGLGERNGLQRTELLILHLALEPHKIKERLGFDGENLFLSKPNLKLLKKIADKVSRYTGVPLRVTDPVVGDGVNSISTGTPFVDRVSFQPFDAGKVLGIPQKIYVTQLASRRVIKEVSINMGYIFSDKQIESILKIVKAKVFESGKAIVPENELHIIFKNA